jgi:hypothetical protein
MSNLKTAGLRTLLEQLGAQVPEPAAAPSATNATPADAGSSVGTSG